MPTATLLPSADSSSVQDHADLSPELHSLAEALKVKKEYYDALMIIIKFGRSSEPESMIEPSIEHVLRQSIQHLKESLQFLRLNEKLLVCRILNHLSAAFQTGSTKTHYDLWRLTKK